MNQDTMYYQPLPPQPAMLLILERNQPVRSIALQEKMRMGRDTPNNCNDIVLSSSIASRNHGEFFWMDGAYYYKDNHSLNGTYYNGKKVSMMNECGSKPVKLSDGDVLRIDRKELDQPHPDAVEMIFSTSISVDESWKRVSLTDKKKIMLGRGCEDGICLHDFCASKQHAVFENTDGAWYIRDLNSTNGLAVNRSMISKPTKLHSFDVILIGNTTIIFLRDQIIYNLIDESRQIYRKSSAVVMRVDIDDVAAKRPGLLGKKKILLKDIHFEVEPGDFTLVLGGAGAGKSTLIKAITGQQRSSEQILDINGEIILDGMDLYKNLKMLKHKIGIVPQYPDYRFQDTVYHTIMDAAKLQLSGEYSNQEISQRVETVIEQMMLSNIRDSKLAVISGGQRKRVQVAIKAVGDISFFTFDEPDAGLDVAGRINQMNQLTAPITKEESVDNAQELMPCTESGNAGLMISHYPDDVAHMYKKVIVLAKSKIDDAGHLAYYGDVPNALEFFGVNKLSEIVLEINSEGGNGRADEFIQKFENSRGDMR